MEDFIYAIILIAIGVGIVLFLNKPKAASTTKVEESSDAKDKKDDGDKEELSEEEKKAKAEALMAERKTILEKLTVPSNLDDIYYYYGSSTGTAEKFTYTLDEEAGYCGIDKSKVIDFNDFSEEDFPKQKLVIICVATHYEGDPCDNTKNFFKWIKKLLKDKKNPKPFAGMNFAIFGLGDSSYELYNEMGKFFDESMEKLGGLRLYEMQCGNAETFSTDDDFNKWKDNLWLSIFAHYEKFETPEQKAAAESIHLTHVKSVEANSDPNALPWSVIVEPKEGVKSATDAAYDMNGKNYLKSVDLPIKSIKELRQTPKDGLSTLEVIFDLRGTGMTYKTAANFAVYPTNRVSDVETFAKTLKLNLDHKFVLTKNESFVGRAARMPFAIPAEGMTVREALTKFIDLTGAVTKKMLKELAPLCSSAEERDKFLQAAKIGSSPIYDTEFIERKVGLIDLVEEYPSLVDNLTLEILLQKCTVIMPRYYTIASSSLAHPEEVAIAVSLTVMDLPEKRTRHGLTSAYLNDIFDHYSKEGSQLKFTAKSFIKDSHFDMPEDFKTPIVMVGPGTGVVPFIGFIQERAKKLVLDSETKLGEAHLYFGCREKNTDFIYRDYLAQGHDTKMITQLNLAFSRPNPDTDPEAKKQYVQDALKTQIEEVAKILTEQNGYFYICGSTKMGHDVQQLLKGHLGEEVVHAIAKDKRLLVELWSA